MLEYGREKKKLGLGGSNKSPTHRSAHTVVEDQIKAQHTEVTHSCEALFFLFSRWLPLRNSGVDPSRQASSLVNFQHCGYLLSCANRLPVCRLRVACFPGPCISQARCVLAHILPAHLLIFGVRSIIGLGARTLIFSTLKRIVFYQQET